MEGHLGRARAAVVPLWEEETGLSSEHRMTNGDLSSAGRGRDETLKGKRGIPVEDGPDHQIIWGTVGQGAEVGRYRPLLN